VRTWGTRPVSFDRGLFWRVGDLAQWYPTSREKRARCPNSLHAALDKAARAPFFKERRMRCTEPTKLHRESGMWGTRGSVVGTGSPGFSVGYTSYFQ
jgi:hypothetical protein